MVVRPPVIGVDVNTIIEVWFGVNVDVNMVGDGGTVVDVWFGVKKCSLLYQFD